MKLKNVRELFEIIEMWEKEFSRLKLSIDSSINGGSIRAIDYGYGKFVDGKLVYGARKDSTLVVLSTAHHYKTLPLNTKIKTIKGSCILLPKGDYLILNKITVDNLDIEAYINCTDEGIKRRKIDRETGRPING